jgi:carboxyl-terminal processing protease
MWLANQWQRWRAACSRPASAVPPGFRIGTARMGERRLVWPQIEEMDAIDWRREGAVGIIRIRSFGQPSAVAQFDAALAALAGVKGIVIDVRGNGGGDTAIARPIMGRFTAQRQPYAQMRRRQGAGLGPAWTEFVEPRGPLCTLPVAVLVDRWSASMAEGFPMGMKALCGARIVGQPMMGLGAAVFPLRLDRTGISLQYSAEPVYDVTGARRDRLVPDVTVPDGVDGLPVALALF